MKDISVSDVPNCVHAREHYIEARVSCQRMPSIAMQSVSFTMFAENVSIQHVLPAAKKGKAYGLLHRKRKTPRLCAKHVRQSQREKSKSNACDCVCKSHNFVESFLQLALCAHGLVLKVFL